jgi:cyclic-di-GMP phosphodiesterase, flagellum assembly factor TipF
MFGRRARARDMIRISTIFIAICMVLVAASLGFVLYSVAGISGSESAIVALTALTCLILYNALSMRLRDRSDVGGQIADLSRGTADLARQVAEFGRRLAAVEGRVTSANSTGADRMQGMAGEINELGGLVRQLAASVAHHEDLLAAAPVAQPVASLRDDLLQPVGAGRDRRVRATAASCAAAADLAQPGPARRRDQARDRREPARHLPAADGDAAAAQGALLRGGDAAAR